MNKSLILNIDTSNSQVTKVELVKNGNKYEYVEKTDPETRSQNVLPLINKALKENNLSLKDITAIEVNAGPGSFTGTRVGVAVANTLGWILGVPVNGQKQVIPVYAESKYDFQV